MANNHTSLLLFFLAMLVLLLSAPLAAAADSVWDKSTEEMTGNGKIVVYRSPTCECCGKWMAHLDRHGFDVADKPVYNMNRIKQSLGITPETASCHTAMIGGYVIEGHVPAGDIKRLLREKPDIIGLSVPDMPRGTPGMEMGEKKDAFKVIAIEKDGGQSTFSEYNDY